MRRLVSALFWVVAATVVLVEEWLWDPIRSVVARVVQWPGLRALGAVIARLPPRWAAVVFLVPVLALVPFKMAGLWLIAQGRVIPGGIVFLGAKIVGTALFAWLYGLTRNALLTLPWFARIHAKAIWIRDTVHRWFHRQPLFRWGRRTARRWMRECRRFVTEIARG